MPELSNPKRERFCQEFLVDLNATKAAIRSGYGKGTARQIGSRMLTKVDIQDRIAELQADRSERLRITQDRVLQELAAIAFSSLGDILEPYGNTLRVKERIDPQALRGIELISNGRYGVRIKTYNKLEALFLLGKHLGMFGNETRTTPERVPVAPPAPVLFLGNNAETEWKRDEPAMPGKSDRSFLRI